MKRKMSKRLLAGWLCLILGLLGLGCGGISYLVTIEHPMKERIPPDKYKSILVAGFLAEGEEKLNLSFETVKYIRTELRKNTPYKVIEEKPIEIPLARIEELPLDTDFWKSLATQAKAELIMWGRVNYTSEPTAELQEITYRTPAGQTITATKLVEMTNFKVELELYFSDGSSGELVYRDNYSQIIPYKGRPSAELPIFFNLMNRMLPSILGVLIPHETMQTRYIISD